MADVQNPGHFLCGVAGVIRNDAGHYLLLKRSPARDFGAGVWECVTGRVNQGESAEQALYREVLEETGLRVRIDLLIGLSWFYRGATTPENEVQGIVFGCSLTDGDAVRHGPEHSEFRWASAADALTVLTATNAGTLWFRDTIQRAEKLYSMTPPGWAGALSAGVTIG